MWTVFEASHWRLKSERFRSEKSGRIRSMLKEGKRSQKELEVYWISGTRIRACSSTTSPDNGRYWQTCQSRWEIIEPIILQVTKSLVDIDHG